jgi:hypothetical protein
VSGQPARPGQRIAGLFVASLAATAWLASAAPLDAATVRLRGTEGPLDASRVVFAVEGLRVTLGTAEQVLAWDRVAGVEGMALTDADRSALAVAEDLWRARSRIARGDPTLARPLLERHWDRFRGTTSETALIVAEGLLRARLAEREWERAIGPALEVARLRRAGISTDRFAALPPAVDATLLLAPELAPVWRVGARTSAAATELDALAEGEGEVARVAKAYRALLRGEPLPAAGGKRPEGATLLLETIAALNEPSAELRAKARAAAAATKGLPDWSKAWIAFAIGQSLVLEADPAQRRIGVLTLLEVPALGAAAPRRVRAAALRLAADTLRALGDTASAAVLEAEITQGGLADEAGPPSGKAVTPSVPAGPVVRLDAEECDASAS